MLIYLVHVQNEMMIEITK